MTVRLVHARTTAFARVRTHARHARCKRPCCYRSCTSNSLHTTQEEAFRRREEALKRKDLELQESLIRFSKFLQENDSKRARAEKKAADEVRSRQSKEKEIEQLAEVLEQLREEKERVTEVLDKYMQ